MEICCACSSEAKFLVKDGPHWKGCCTMHKIIWSRPEYSIYNYEFKVNPFRAKTGGR